MEPAHNSKINAYNTKINTVLEKAKTAASSNDTQGRIKQLSTRERNIVYEIATKGYLSNPLSEQAYNKLCEKLDGMRVSKFQDAGILEKAGKKYTRTLSGHVGTRISSSELIRTLTKQERNHGSYIP